MFDFVQLGLIMAVAAAILGSALAYAWRDATRGAPRSRTSRRPKAELSSCSAARACVLTPRQAHRDGGADIFAAFHCEACRHGGRPAP